MENIEYDPVGGETPDLAKIDDNHYLVVYQGANDDGYAGIIQYGRELRP